MTVIKVPPEWCPKVGLIWIQPGESLNGMEDPARRRRVVLPFITERAAVAPGDTDPARSEFYYGMGEWVIPQSGMVQTMSVWSRAATTGDERMVDVALDSKRQEYCAGRDMLNPVPYLRENVTILFPKEKSWLSYILSELPPTAEEAVKSVSNHSSTKRNFWAGPLRVPSPSTNRVNTVDCPGNKLPHAGSRQRRVVYVTEYAATLTDWSL